MAEINKTYMHEYFYTNNTEYIRALDEVKKFKDKFRKYNVIIYNDKDKSILRVWVNIIE
ncbi:hypothetical protein GCM10008908_09240 [Clostridium subterminale]|uniref:Uncharacterized protein n=1 Tax=Clostridium subterminale TaxID=1550 RepID=A0ABN1KJF7_CLOSU